MLVVRRAPIQVARADFNDRSAPALGRPVSDGRHRPSTKTSRRRGTLACQPGWSAPRLTLDGKFYMTLTGHAQLKEELATLMNVERPGVVKVVSWAAANRDRSENADYQYGKRRLSEIDRRAGFLVSERGRHPGPAVRAIDRDRVFFCATVAYVGAFEGERTVTIVGVDEADMRVGKISLTAPIATAPTRHEPAVATKWLCTHPGAWKLLKCCLSATQARLLHMRMPRP